MTDFLASLNPAQRQSVEHYCGPLLVVAGAGTGKTRALTYRIDRPRQHFGGYLHQQSRQRNERAH